MSKKKKVHKIYVNKKEINFHPFIDGRDTNQSYHSLEAALVGVIAYKYEGCNHHADTYFIIALEKIHETRLAGEM